MSAIYGLLSLVQHSMGATFYRKSHVTPCATSGTFPSCCIFCV